MNKVLYGFLLTIFSGFSTLLGYFIIFIKGDKNKIISFSLSFASGVMLTISIIDLIPSSFNYLIKYHFLFRLLLMTFFFVLGCILSIYIKKIIDNKEHSSLKKVGLISICAIILHNIPEGIITFIVSGVDINLGIKLALAISFHNIPEGISIAIPIYYATRKKIKTFFYVFISSISEIFGALLTYFFLQDLVNDLLIGCIFSIISGIMINISITELLPESFNYKENKYIYFGFIIGIFIMIISHILN